MLLHLQFKKKNHYDHLTTERETMDFTYTFQGIIQIWPSEMTQNTFKEIWQYREAIKTKAIIEPRGQDLLMNETHKYLHDLDLRSIDCTASVHFSGISFESQQWFLNGHHAGSTKACFNEAYKRPHHHKENDDERRDR